MSQAKKISDELERVLGETIKQVTLDATSNLIESTPVDTGWARANWVPSLDEPITSEGDSARQATAVTRVATASPEGVDKAWVSNNVPYIRSLDGGSSRQAPAGFVRYAIDVAVRIQLPRAFQSILRRARR